GEQRTGAGVPKRAEGPDRGDADGGHAVVERGAEVGRRRGETGRAGDPRAHLAGERLRVAEPGGDAPRDGVGVLARLAEEVARHRVLHVVLLLREEVHERAERSRVAERHEAAPGDDLEEGPLRLVAERRLEGAAARLVAGER